MEITALEAGRIVLGPYAIRSVRLGGYVRPSRTTGAAQSRVVSTGKVQLRGLVRLVQPFLGGEIRRREKAELMRLKALVEAEAGLAVARADHRLPGLGRHLRLHAVPLIERDRARPGDCRRPPGGGGWRAASRREARQAGRRRCVPCRSGNGRPSIGAARRAGGDLCGVSAPDSEPAGQHQLHLRGLQPGRRPGFEVLRSSRDVGAAPDRGPCRAGRNRCHRGPPPSQGRGRTATSACAVPRCSPMPPSAALGVDPQRLGLRPFAETYDELGEVTGQVVDLGERWETARVARQAAGIHERLVDETIELAIPPSEAWEWLQRAANVADRGTGGRRWRWRPLVVGAGSAPPASASWAAYRPSRRSSSGGPTSGSHDGHAWDALDR